MLKTFTMGEQIHQFTKFFCIMSQRWVYDAAGCYTGRVRLTRVFRD